MLYDVTLRELFQVFPKKLFLRLSGSPPLELLSVSLPKVMRREADLVVRLADGRICHFEIQTRPEPGMLDRMLGYRWLIRT